jgi:hypothetical protein
MRVASLLFSLVAALPVSAQIVYTPSAASTQLYFAQLAVGGPDAAKWATTITLVNPNTASAAAVTLSFYGDSGAGLALNFGTGAKTTLSVTVPAGGVKAVSSSAGTSSDYVVGWAVAVSDIPITGTVVYRMTQKDTDMKDKAIWDVAAPGTGPTYSYNSYANGALGLALANPSTRTIHLQIVSRDQAGASLGTAPVTLAPNGHTSFNLNEAPTSLAAGFAGSITISSTDTTPATFVAWAVNVSAGLLSPLPPGETQAPAPPARLAADVTARLLSAAAALVKETDFDWGAGVTDARVLEYISKLGVVIDSDGTGSAAKVSASYNNTDNKIHLSQSALELAAGSPAALGFLIVHVATRGFSTYSSVPISDPALNADTVAVFTLLKAGYDPAGTVDWFARLTTAKLAGLNIDNALTTMFDVPNGTTTRITRLWTAATSACQSKNGVKEFCDEAFALWYPNAKLLIK